MMLCSIVGMSTYKDFG